MADDDVQAAIDELYGAPLEDFVSERTRLAKALRAGGERSAADEVAKLTKPTAAAWALNHVAREDPDAVEEWLDATDALREASSSGEGLRDAMAAQREATARLTGVVRERAEPTGRPLSGAMVERVRALLHSATAEVELADRLRAGRITEETSAEGLALTAPAPASASASGKRSAAKAPARKGAKRKAAAPPAREAAAPARPLKRDRVAEARAARRSELERRIAAAQAEARKLRAESDRREATAASAHERLEAAERDLRRSESEAAAAHQAAKDADAAARGAERELRQLEGLLRRAGG